MYRSMRTPTLLSVALTLLVSGAAVASLGCRTVRDQLSATNVNGCITKNCTDPDAAAHRSCEAACRSTYGR